MSNGAETRTRRSQEKIIGAAEAAFLKHGYLGTSMDAVAELAGVSKQTVYSNFGSKEALFLRVVHEMTGGAAETLFENDQSVEYPDSVEDFFYAASVAQLSVVMTSRLMRLPPHGHRRSRALSGIGAGVAPHRTKTLNQ